MSYGRDLALAQLAKQEPITMPEPFDFESVLQLDPRYTVEAYEFVCDALSYARKVLGLGTIEVVGEGTADAREERHLTGQELCEASRRLALDRYGMMAKLVLNNWGVHATGDLGEIVYNLIRAEQMSKSTHDRREDFDNVFDFQKSLQDDFDFSMVRQSRRNLPKK